MELCKSFAKSNLKPVSSPITICSLKSGIAFFEGTSTFFIDLNLPRSTPRFFQGVNSINISFFPVSEIFLPIILFFLSKKLIISCR